MSQEIAYRPPATNGDDLPTNYLFGADQIEKCGSKKKLSKQGGILVVQSERNVERLKTSQLLFVGHVRPAHTQQQIERIVALALEYANTKVQTWIPLDIAGRKAMWKLVQDLLPEVFIRVPITTKTHDGAFAGMTPGELDDNALQTVREILLR